ncbi:murein hydrolase activator EnvC family protein [Mucilaginibacter defluvii]|uniref:Peptidoglycan DD-metalloendopeptidase family protein n=1 Tax=Mucilaginibacter defluvii TaxID=1196019 RepID=A0ABP9G079_9SPHI
MKLFRLLLIFISTCVAVNSFAQSSAELKRRKEKLNDELAELNREYDKVRKDKSVSIKQLNILRAQINLREDKIKTINSEVRNLDNQISENTNTVHTLQGQLDQLKKDYAGMVLFAYHNKSAYNKLMFVFAANDFNQAYKRLKYLQQFGNYRQRQAESIQGTQKDLGIKINELDRTKKEKRTLLQDQEREKQNLDKQRSDQAVVVSKLSKQQGYLKQQQRTKSKQISAINRQISSAIRREIAEARRKAEAEARERAAAERARAAAAERDNKPAPVAANKPKEITKSSSNSEVLNSTPEAARLSNDFLGNRGSLPWPVANGTITQGFGTYYIEGIKTENTGLEIRTAGGAAARAVFSGEVTTVGNISGTYVVIIRHGEYFTAYSNLRSVSVAKGQKVSTKQAVGVVATDGATGETVLHFDLYKGQTPVNPKIWLAPD